jgi:membrane-bound lytic murein transglycosylase
MFMRKTTTMRRKLPILLLGGFFFYSQYSIAEMYKWVDDEGNTHYTQSPPPGDVKAKTIKPPPKVNPEHSQKQLQNRQKSLNEARDNRQKAGEEKREREQELEQQRADCEKAKARLASYQRPRVNLVDKDGNPSRATEEQRQAEIARSKDLISKLCK